MSTSIHNYKPGDTLRPGQRIRFDSLAPEDTWLVITVTECAASVERELKAPKLVEIKDDEGNVTRSFFARSSGDRLQISPRSIVSVVEAQ